MSSTRSNFFEHVEASLEQQQSAAVIYEALTKKFDDLDDFLGWTFDEESERSGAVSLAHTNPDALILAVYQWNTYLTNRRQRPRRWMQDYSAMKRMVASALAEVYPSTTAPVSNDVMKVAIWVPWLPGNPNNNILRVAAGYLGGLNKQPGVEAALVITNEFSHPVGTEIPNVRHDVRPYRDLLADVLGEYGSAPTALHIAPPPFVEEGNFNWFLDFQQTYRPDAIFVPNFEMSSAHIHGFGQSCPTVYLQTSVRNRPPYDFTRYLYLGERRKIDDSHIHPEKWHYHPFGYGNFGAGSGLTRAEIGLPDDAFVAVSAGNRLEQEIDPEIIEIMANLMEQRSDMVWMLMGVKSEEQIVANLGPRFSDMKDRVVCNGYVREIGDYLSLSDVYANPRRTGGAVSMALAVYGDTPVLSFFGNDACNFLIDEMMCDTPEAYQQKLAELASNPAQLEQATRAQREKFEANHTITASAADLVEHLRAARIDWTPV